jgi:hypothetical protein
MKAFLIDPEARSIAPIELENLEQLPDLIGYPTLESDSLGDGDKLYFDEECFIRGADGRFQIDKLIPVAGKGVVVGERDGEPADVQLSLEALQQRTVFQ